MKRGIEDWRSEDEKSIQWGQEDLQYRAGWDLDGIRRWMGAERRDCETVEWVRPSLERIF